MSCTGGETFLELASRQEKLQINLKNVNLDDRTKCAGQKIVQGLCKVLNGSISYSMTSHEVL